MAPTNVCMIGTGEYTTGFVGGSQSTSDKKIGVIAPVLFDLRRRGKAGRLSMVGTTGTKFEAIRAHLQKNISNVYNGLDTSFDSFPPDSVARDIEAYKKAIDSLNPGDACTIFSPDPTHYPIALYAIERGVHVLLTKPATKLLAHHIDLLVKARERNVLVFVEHHKRFDPAYADARFRASSLGPFNYFYAYMSQPKSQLETFKAWAGKDSDISYYLNSHHIDVHDSMIGEGWDPVRVTASASLGIAEGLGCQEGTEDTITLLVDWVQRSGGGTENKPIQRGTGIYTASWTAPRKAGVHSQQRFHYLAANGEIRVDQAKRGYEVCSDDAGINWLNPFYMRYSPDEKGNFGGQGGYGYQSIEKFIDSVEEVNNAVGVDSKAQVLTQINERGLPTLSTTVCTAAILEAGRRSLDEQRPIVIDRDRGRGAEGWSLQ
ncbi:MAG: hypothetical protein Q9159_003591 [Coniocarpon cinnabarinum]